MLFVLLLWVMLCVPACASWLDELSPYDVLFLGEQHDRPADHAMQREVLEHLRAAVVGAEMFQIPFQPALDAFSAGQLDLPGLRAKTDWENRWGHDFSWYAPGWEAVRRNGHRLVALRYGREVNMRLGTDGLAAVPPEQRPLAAFDEYDYGGDEDRLRETYAWHAHDEQGFRRFLRVQTLWEEGMAGRLAAAFEPGRKMVVLVGKGHLTMGYGLPFRTLRQLRARGLSARCGVVLCDPKDWERGRADVVYRSGT